MAIRRMLYRRGMLASFRADVPVISVGNLSVGGTGKSPTVIKLVRFLIERVGLRVAIVSRGYGRSSVGMRVVSDGTAIRCGVEEAGDEPVMLAEALPSAIVIVSEDRALGAREAVLRGADVIVLDDGYQHLKLKRDLNILLLDASIALGSVLPFGRARERLSAARDADIVIFTNAEYAERGEKLAKKMFPFVSEYALVATMVAAPIGFEQIAGPGVETATMEDHTLVDGKSVVAVSSIARPERFHRMLAELGSRVMQHTLRDHADYTDATVERAIDQAKRARAGMIITTTKDAVKSREFFRKAAPPMPVYVLHYELEFISGETEFFERLTAASTHKISVNE